MALWAGDVPCHPVEVAGIVYVEVPKAGCTSVKAALAPFKGGITKQDDVHKWFGYTHARSTEEMRRWLGTRWLNLFRFTVVRHPIARFESFYWGLSYHERGAYGDINRFVLEEFPTSPWAWDIHAIPQSMLLGGIGGFDFVGKTEDMEEVSGMLSDVTGTTVKIGHLNRSSKHRVKLEPEARDRLREIYIRDFEELGYE